MEKTVSLVEFVRQVGGVLRAKTIIGCASATTIQKALKSDDVTVVLKDGQYSHAYRVTQFPNPNKAKFS